MTTNISECMNAILKEARGWPVVALVESFRALLQKWFFKHRSSSSSSVVTSRPLTEWAENFLREQEELARPMTVSYLKDYSYFFLFRL